MSLDGEDKETKQLPTKRFITGSNITEYRDNLVDNYRQKNKGVLQKINENSEITANEILSLIARSVLVKEAIIRAIDWVIYVDSFNVMKRLDAVLAKSRDFGGCAIRKQATQIANESIVELDTGLVFVL